MNTVCSPTLIFLSPDDFYLCSSSPSRLPAFPRHARQWDAPARTVPLHLNDALLMGLIALMRESKLRRVAEWPARAPFGGGIVVRVGFFDG